MRKFLFVLALLLTTPLSRAATPVAASDWKAKVNTAIPLLGHRNWILIVDSAYPLQVAPGVETIETSADQLDVDGKLAIVSELREATARLQEEQRVSYKQLALETSEAAALEDRARRKTEALLEQLQHRMDELRKSDG